MIGIIVMLLLILLYLLIGFFWTYKYFRIQDNATIFWLIWNWPLDLQLRIVRKLEDRIQEKLAREED